MAKKSSGIDQLFVKAEQLAYDFSLFPESRGFTIDSHIEGLVSESRVDEAIASYARMDVDAYIRETVGPSEDKSRPGVKAILKKLGGTVIAEEDMGPLLMREMEIEYKGDSRRVLILAQERKVSNGVWMPWHHIKAVEIIRKYAQYSIPIVTLMDTPGADAGEEANKNNQAHSISRLIAEMAAIHLPTIGIIFGNGYSGGAIPLATTNLLLSLRDGVFNTIQPQGLASIARKYDLSWQECARYVGVSAFELYRQGCIDGIIDYVPGERENQENLIKAILTGLRSIEQRAVDFVKNNEYIFEHYHRSIRRYVNPSTPLKILQKHKRFSLAANPTGQLNVFGVACRYTRYLSLRKRLHSTTLSSYGRLSVTEIPKGDLRERVTRDMEVAFSNWYDSPMEIKYDETLQKSWKAYRDRKEHLHEQRGRIARFLFGDPRQSFYTAQENLLLTYGFHLYNRWKSAAQNNFMLLLGKLSGEQRRLPTGGETVLDVIMNEELRMGFTLECENLIVFDLVYDNIIHNLISIAKEAKEMNIIRKDSVGRLLESSLASATKKMQAMLPNDVQPENLLREQFSQWMKIFMRHPQQTAILKSVGEWKKIVYPRVSEPLFAIVTFLFEKLLPAYYDHVEAGEKFDGRINLRNIGIKDFWNRLNIAYQDLLIHDILVKEKKRKRISAKEILDFYFSDFEELYGELMTADPHSFPGFRISIEDALAKKVVPCGVITGVGHLKIRSIKRRVGVMVSNLDFQAGAFDMASAEKMCKLMVECALRKLPLICFVSSGGMQTKEGAGALFSMSVVNDRITRFVRDNDLPVICFGFGDCTGGAQASFVTHPLVHTYYFSGCNMPFAGQIVVPAYLSTTATLSNYLSLLEGSMDGLVQHPFSPDLDAQLREVDAAIPLPKDKVEDVLQKILKGEADTVLEEEDEDEHADKHVRPVKSVLLHARGCTADKLIRVAKRKGIRVVLVQSDPDMDSYPAEQLGENDSLVCIGGNTPDESYLNAGSVLHIAEREGVDSLHPGIGFLSENAGFASLCHNHGINFIGPPIRSMELMGNKSNAIHTAMRCNVPVVPGSHGILTSVQAAEATAGNIGYPVLIKAVHGGGGKGILVVETPDKFRESFFQISAEAKSAFGNGDVYLEKYVTSLRHIEAQILRDYYGNCKVLGIRDCSVQRNNQKVIEESGSTLLPANLEESICRYAGMLADEIGYTGAGTVEFIYDLKENSIYFMEMNTRLQVEHPVTEAVTGVDIVGLQFDIASGSSINDLEIRSGSYAMELRINAEKAILNSSGELQLLPHPGRIEKFHFPEEPGIQLIQAVSEGKEVTPFYDSMIVQLICHGESREGVINRLLAYLEKIIIRGVSTNIALLKRILSDEVFRGGHYDTTYLPLFMKRLDVHDLVQSMEHLAGGEAKSLDRSTVQIEGSKELKVLAPSAGVFYLTPSPSEPLFVEEGKIISTSDTLCLMEAMKIFSPLNLNKFNREDAQLYDSSLRYRVVRINPTSGQAVNTGDLLFIIEPIEGEPAKL
ncbi:MAG: ATP-grasp domain-containing protein [Planctomycetes bacterium]|nr:ATP-grasp domain-containing protein [Planctomycetota bacterium]